MRYLVKLLCKDGDVTGLLVVCWVGLGWVWASTYDDPFRLNTLKDRRYFVDLPWACGFAESAISDRKLVRQAELRKASNTLLT